MNTPLKQHPLDQPAIDENSTLTARALKAMAHPLRWRILCTLGSNELSVGEIVEKTGTSQSNVSQHLEQLRNKNIVTARKEANRVYYRIRNDQLLMLIGTMREVLCPANLDTRESTARNGGGLH
uniref:Transcriptional regulator, ArsR family n=1 Tax=Candidatus Kentrum sp. TC TaxID=2126339 RepID=A0A450ZDP6_9GAMM|nr:MAG: transcriptional regulator, ArsR family [Candidatus Kentron sp. TC]VFK37565.1 MAG: DNA-binding transcriptional regulator, ArsR family [Candidatus Kentron sp. TC]VFK51900.1 MAG: DNA-binding transcriptional regulator, ArsR family [Candidatus Kentron sp. TC]